MESAIIPVQLFGLFHRGQHRIGICFANHGSINGPLRQAGAQWSQTHKCWHVPLQKEHYEKVMTVLKPKASIDRSKLDQYLEGLRSGGMKADNRQATIALKPEPVKMQKSNLSQKLSKENEAALASARQALILKGYSTSTQRTYLNELHTFFTLLGKTAADTLSTQRLKDYLSYCHTQLGLSENTIHSRMNAMKFYYEQVLGKEKLFWEIPRPKKHQQLPKVISEEKILQGLMTIKNLKHKTLILLAYSCGLRVSEATRVKRTDFNWDRMQLLVHKSKGKKDRMVPLAHSLQPILEAYQEQYKPDVWLFENHDKTQPYSTKSAQVIFKQAYAMFDLPPSITFHS
jgi:site-specific recombinase XerD